MEFRVLGSLEVLDHGRDIAPRRPKQRALLALLIVHRNEVITTDRLIDEMWGAEPPATAAKALQGHVSALRKLLGASRIDTEPGGYRLRIADGELDSDRFESAFRAARALPDAEARVRRLTEAMTAWRGNPFADLGFEDFAQSEIVRLDALRLAALEAQGEAELARGRHVEHVPELERLVARHPLHEGLRALLMVALYRSGRQSDALRVFTEGRRLFAEELGIEPGSQLRALERRILVQDAALDLPAGGRSLPRQERKVVTALVAEVRPARPSDPEDLEVIAGPVLERMRSVIERFGGTAEPLFANAMLGVFGAPRAHDDDTQRAIRAALELREQARNGLAELRIGIERGDALVTIGGDAVAIAGDVLADASRLQATASAADIVVGEAAQRATASMIEFEAAGPGAWRAVAELPAGTAPVEPPFVGRRDELALLERTFVRACRERSVQLATISAEPGGGKTRLVAELRAALEAKGEPHLWRQGRCLPYGEGVTYWALGDIVKAQAGILASDGLDASGRKLSAAVASIEPDEVRRAWLERALGPLVGIDDATTPGDRQQAFAAWSQFLEAIANREPLIIALEDIHWADSALLAFIEHLVGHASGVPMVVVCTARLELLEAHPDWGGGKRNAAMIALAPLADDDTGQLLSSLLGRPPQPATIRLASGNPLFARELAMSAERLGSEDIRGIPESLHAVISARLDALPPELKDLACNAAVLGEVFWPGALAPIAGLAEHEVEERLSRLVANDVVRRRRSSAVANQAEFSFLHVLVRDVAYGQIPRRDRIAKHRAAGEWIEQLAGDRLTSHAELIAHHYVHALEIARARDDAAEAQALRSRARTFLTLAGDGALTLEATRAEAFYRRALDLTGDDDPGHGRLLGRLGQVAQLTGRLSEAEQLCRQAIGELQGAGDLQGAGEAMGALMMTLWRLGRPERQRRSLAVDAVRTLERLPRGAELVRAYTHRATHELHAGRARACGVWSKKALALAEQLGMVALTVPALHHLGIARFESGDEGGIDDIREAVRIGLEAGLSSETATAHSNLAATMWVTDGPVAALAEKRAAAGFASSRGLISLEKTIRTESLWQQFDAGAWDDALASADQLLGSDRESGLNRLTTMALTVKARILAERGRTSEAAELEDDFLVRARELRDPQDLGPALTAAAAIRQALGDLDGAASLIAELERVTRGRDPSQRVHELPHAARVCRESGTIAVAEALIPSRRAPRYLRARLCLESARALVAEAHGRHADAGALHLASAAKWAAFGCPAEQAHARLGHGRSLLALDRRDEAIESIREARRIGERLGARQIIAEADRLAG